MEFRSIPREDHAEFGRVFFRTMGFELPGEAANARNERDFLPERSIGAYDEGVLVGTTYSHLFEMTLPGGAIVPACGVTAVGVVSTHRRRGIVRELMLRQLKQARDNGEPIAVLLASEGGIYGRFGYGPSLWTSDVDINTKDVSFAGPPPPGRVRFVDPETADKLFPSIHETWRRAQPGALNRPPSWWETIREDRKPTSGQVVYEDEAGEPRGFARYTVTAKWSDAGTAAHKLSLQDLIAITPDAYHSLWRFLLGVDLVRTVQAGPRPVDEPLRWLVADPRVVHAKVFRDLYWTRVLDVERVLSERRYGVDVDVVLEVRDDFLPELDGRYSVRGSRDTAECVRTGAEPDVEIAMRDLSAMVLGGVSLAELVRSGRAVVRDPDRAASVGLAFMWTPKPWSATFF